MLGTESKTKLADKVKTYIKRGKEKLDELASVCPEKAFSAFFQIRIADFAPRRMNGHCYFLRKLWQERRSFASRPDR